MNEAQRITRIEKQLERLIVLENGGGTGGGHTIQDEGVDMTQRTNLNFVGSGVLVTDDAGNDASVVSITATVPAPMKIWLNTNFI